MPVFRRRCLSKFRKVGPPENIEPGLHKALRQVAVAIRNEAGAQPAAT